MAKGKHEAPSAVGRISRRPAPSRRRAPVRNMSAAPRRKSRRRFRGVKLLPIAAVLVLVMGMAVGGTIAYFVDTTNSVTGSYTAGEVSHTVADDYSVTNTGNVDAYVRVSVTQSVVNESGENVLQSQVPELTLNEGWIQGTDGYFYNNTALSEGDTAGPAFTYTEPTLDEGLEHQITVNVQTVQADAVSGDNLQNGWPTLSDQIAGE